MIMLFQRSKVRAVKAFWKKNTTAQPAERWRFFSKNPQGLALTGKLYELTLHYNFI